MNLKQKMNKFDMKSLGEPWRCPLSYELYQEVDGFINFLKEKYTYNEQVNEIRTKIDELQRWKHLARQVLASNGEGYVDAFALAPLPFIVEEFLLNGMFYRVMITDHGFDVEEEHSSDEEKYSETRYQMPIAYSSGPEIGYLLGDCLRSVSSGYEKREIFSGFKCEVDCRSKMVLRVFEEEPVVLKIVGKSGRFPVDERLRREFKVQMMLTKLSPKNITPLTMYNENESSIMSVCPRAGRTDLLDFLISRFSTEKRGLEKKIVAKIFKGVAEGLLAAHSIGIAHRDLSLENVVVDDDLRAQIIDWGHATSTSLDERMINHVGIAGKMKYMAPELFDKSRARIDPFKTDAFSFGVCLFTALTGQMPFNTVDDKRAHLLFEDLDKLLLVVKKSDLSPSAVDLMKKCLRFDPSERSNIFDIANHEFFVTK